MNLWNSQRELLICCDVCHIAGQFYLQLLSTSFPPCLISSDESILEQMDECVNRGKCTVDEWMGGNGKERDKPIQSQEVKEMYVQSLKLAC